MSYCVERADYGWRLQRHWGYIPGRSSSSSPLRSLHALSAALTLLFPTCTEISLLERKAAGLRSLQTRHVHLEMRLRMLGAILLLSLGTNGMLLNPLNTELNPICHLPALVGAHHILHVSRVMVNYAPWQLCLLTVALICKFYLFQN